MLALILAILVTMIMFPTAPTSKGLHRLLVDPCVHRLSRIRPGHTVFTLALIGTGSLLFLLFEAEGLRLFSFMAPEIIAWSAVFDVAVLFDILVFTASLVATTRLRAVREQALAGLQGVIPRVMAFIRAGHQRARRLRQATSAKPRRSEDPDPFGLAYAG